MSMNIFVYGFTPPDEKWRAMKKVWDACREAGIDVPREVEKFFDDGPPDENGVQINLEKVDGAMNNWRDKYRDGYEVHLDKLPKDVRIIRFVCSY